MRARRTYSCPMAHVELNDDSIRRYVVQHYRYDPERRETRHVQVAVVDNEREYRVEYQRANAVLEDRRARGEVVDPREPSTAPFVSPDTTGVRPTATS